MAGSRPATRSTRTPGSRAKAWTWARAWTPVPITATTAESGRASSFVATTLPAAVRTAVTWLPSISATGEPSAGSKQQMTA